MQSSRWGSYLSFEDLIVDLIKSQDTVNTMRSTLGLPPIQD